jgi:hypothetical protein
LLVHALCLAEDLGIILPDEQQYRALQRFGSFDSKTSSWFLTPPDIRTLSWALFMNHLHYGWVFIYYNGAQSYYAARGFRGYLLK